MNDLLDAISDRIKTPFYGYVSIAFLCINWREITFLIVSNDEISRRIEYFDENTTLVCLAIYPVIIGVVLSILGPWLKWFLTEVTTYPVNRISLRAIKSENDLVLERTRLENSRNALFDEQSQTVVELAKKEDELADIQDVAAREHAKIGIEELRLSRLSQDDNSFHSKKKRSLQRMAASYHKLAEHSQSANNKDEADEYRNKALELEKQI